MKKIMAILLAALCALPLAGCGTPSDTGTDADTNTGANENWLSIVLNAPTAKLETSDGQTVYVMSDITSLRGLAGLSLEAAPLEPADSPDDWVYRITFNPSDKVTGAEELVVSFHDSYVQIGSEYYLPEEDVPYESILEWASGKFDFFL